MPDSNQTNQMQFVVTELLADKKRDRFWKNIRTFTIIGAMLGVTTMTVMRAEPGYDANGLESEGYASLVRISGEIGPDLSASYLELDHSLLNAFKDPKAKGVVLLINSPGGTPVQAAGINERIQDLKKKYNKKVISVGEDMMTSGAYLIAVSADKIYANESTIVGSIGVISSGFGFVDFMEKIGVESRRVTAGVNKARLDPFSKQKTEDTEKLKQVLNKLHGHFKEHVIKGRNSALKLPPNPDETIFSGDFWEGTEAKELGLIDEIGSVHTALNKEFKVTRFKEYKKMTPLSLLFGEKIGAGMAQAVSAKLGLNSQSISLK